MINNQPYIQYGYTYAKNSLKSIIQNFKLWKKLKPLLPLQNTLKCKQNQISLLHIIKSLIKNLTSIENNNKVLLSFFLPCFCYQGSSIVNSFVSISKHTCSIYYSKIKKTPSVFIIVKYSVWHFYKQSKRNPLNSEPLLCKIWKEQ